MKNLLLLQTIDLTLSCCDKDGQFFAGKELLPPENQTGANTFGLL
nr:hypothetical protein [uncultured Flavobacterium sp.]